MAEVAGIECRLCCFLRVPLSFGDIIVQGFFNCFLMMATTSALICFGTQTSGFSVTIVPVNFKKLGTIRRKNLICGINT